MSFKCKTQFLDNRVIAKWNLKKEKKNYGTRVPWKYSSGTRVLWMELEFHNFFFNGTRVPQF